MSGRGTLWSNEIFHQDVQKTCWHTLAGLCKPLCSVQPYGSYYLHYLGDFFEQEQLISVCTLEQQGAAQRAGAALEAHEGPGAPAIVLEGVA